MEKKQQKVSGIRYDARISEMKQQISILENEKCDVKDKLSSYTEGLIKTKKSSHYNDAVRATYKDLVMMGGVGINNVEKVARTVLTHFNNMDIERLQKQRF